MSDTKLPMDDESRVDRLMSKFDDEGVVADADAAPAPESEPTEETPVEKTGESAPPEAASADEPEATPEPEPAIEPPSTWKAELKDDWKALPVETQRKLAQWETERNAGVNQRLEEASRTRREAEEAKKAADAQRSAILQEQQRYAQQLGAVVQAFDQFDPVLNRYRALEMNGELVKLARENPADYAALEAEVRQRQRVVSLVQAEQQRNQAQAMQAHFAREEQTLVSRIPEFADPNKAKQELDGLRAHAVSAYGFRPEEVQTIADHRYVLLVRDAKMAQTYKAELDALKAKQADGQRAAQAALAAKRTPPKPTPVVRPEPSNDAGASKGAVDRNKAILKQVKGVKGLSQRAELLSQLMDETT